MLVTILYFFSFCTICTKEGGGTSGSGGSAQTPSMKVETLFKVRTITAFIQLKSSDFTTNVNTNELKVKIEKCGLFLHDAQETFEQNGYNVQTVRIATNPFEEWLIPKDDENDQNMKAIDDKLAVLDCLLQENNVHFCSLGPSLSLETIKYCPIIVNTSSKFSCSAEINDPSDITTSNAIVECIDTISRQNELGNFRFCAAACCKDFIPFFPAAKCCSIHDDDGFKIRFSIGLENGELVHELLAEAKTIDNIPRVFKDGMLNALLPIQNTCINLQKDNCEYMGIDTSINPSLDKKGSIAYALEQIDTISKFGESGTLAAVSTITSILQRQLYPIKLIGYCGVMLPLCEDTRLSELATDGDLSVQQLLMISSVCGVGIDTVPIAAIKTIKDRERLAGLILDVVGIASKWDKSLSCRVFPLLPLDVGMSTDFDSPYLCNTNVLSI